MRLQRCFGQKNKKEAQFKRKNVGKQGLLEKVTKVIAALIAHCRDSTAMHCISKWQCQSSRGKFPVVRIRGQMCRFRNDPNCFLQ